MSQPKDQMKPSDLSQFAKETLDAMAAIAESAEREIKDKPTSIFVSGTADEVQALASGIGKARAETIESLRVSAKEPFVSRVVVLDDVGERHVYYVTRGSVSNIFGDAAKIANYRAPIGRLASLPVKSEFQIKVAGKTIEVEVIETSKIRPQKSLEVWDSVNTLLESVSYPALTIASLRLLLPSSLTQKSEIDLLTQIKQAASKKENILMERRRDYLRGTQLRDQPTLDEIQDNIFRQPIDDRRLILGPPGTGKTTTLIKRLGQKLDEEFLDSQEKLILSRSKEMVSENHKDSWIMFTPTILLKSYVKEAFNREGIAASDAKIHTWDAYRREITRDVLRILSPSGYILRETRNYILATTVESQSEWFLDFWEYCCQAFSQELSDAAETIARTRNPEFSRLGKALLKEFADQKGEAILVSASKSYENSKELKTLIDELATRCDRLIDQQMRFQLAKDPNFFSKLADFLSTMARDANPEVDEEEDDEGVDADAFISDKINESYALRLFSQAIRASARATVQKRSISKKSKNSIVLDWASLNGTPIGDTTELGLMLVEQRAARLLINPIDRFFSARNSHYRNFRRARQADKRWYSSEKHTTRDIDPLELDLLILCSLRAAKIFLSRPSVLANLEANSQSPLNQIRRLFRTQVLVDEATDFSPLQIAAMFSLVELTTGSIFCCGDFNQRFTSWGVSTVQDFRWAIPGLAVESIAIAYRQTEKLNDFSRQLITLGHGRIEDAAKPGKTAVKGIPPVLGRSLNTLEKVVDWLKSRITEIVSHSDSLPSIAILVVDEVHVGPLADALNAELEERNLKVVACRDGMAIGEETDVRVFDVRHVKGMEFEAALYVGIDLLAEKTKDLFPKYLYVGTTRAAYFLGMTCSGDALPSPLGGLEGIFAENFNLPRSAAAIEVAQSGV